MIVTWDNAKRIANLDKHGLDFADLEPEFFVNSVVAPVRERRFKAIVISMRAANRKERNLLHGHSN